MYTTLNLIRAHSPCVRGWRTLLDYLGKTEPDDEPLSIVTILDSNGINDAFWALRAVDGHDREKLLFAVWCAHRVGYPLTDQRLRDVLDVAERYANGRATIDELRRARADAASAAHAAIALYSPAQAAASAVADAADYVVRIASAAETTGAANG
jgi:hypothetical protein